MFRSALRLLGNKGKVARILYSCCSMCSTALKWLGNKGKVVRYLFRIALRLLGLVGRYGWFNKIGFQVTILPLINICECENSAKSLLLFSNCFPIFLGYEVKGAFKGSSSSASLKPS